MPPTHRAIRTFKKGKFFISSLKGNHIIKVSEYIYTWSHTRPLLPRCCHHTRPKRSLILAILWPTGSQTARRHFHLHLEHNISPLPRPIHSQAVISWSRCSFIYCSKLTAMNDDEVNNNVVATKLLHLHHLPDATRRKGLVFRFVSLGVWRHPYVTR